MTLNDERRSPAEAPDSPSIGDSSVPLPGDSSAPVALASPPTFVPADLRAPWGWLDLLVFVLVAFLATIALAVITYLVFAAFGVKLAQLKASPRAEGLFTVVNQVLIYLALFGFLVAQLRLRFGSPFWRTIGWRRLETGRFPRPLVYAGFLTGGVSLAVVVLVGSAVFGSSANVPMEALFRDRLTAALILVLGVVVAPVVEETIFRGFLYPVAARTLGRGAAVAAVGTLFGLLHAPQLWGAWTQVVLLIGVGIVLTCARAVKGTVVASYLLHVSYNFFLSVGFLIGSHWLRVLPTRP